ncbi:MAG: type 4a pilus biogenesis protein PilO [Patescibacteria group bacterium]
MQFITPIFLIVVSVAVFFGFVDPQYKKISETKTLEQQYEEALSKSRELQEIKANLLSEYNAFRPEDVAKLEKMLPDNIDNVRLIIEIDNVAKKYGLSVKNLIVREESSLVSTTNKKQIGPDTKDYSSVTLEFSVGTSYNTFLKFLKDLEQSLRLVDVVSVNFRAQGEDFDDYRVAIRTYWLK